MFAPIAAFSGFSVSDLEKARKFYNSLGFKTEKEGIGLNLLLPGGAKVFMYPKDNHEPATFTILNLVVDSIDEAVEALKAQGITFDQADLGGDAKTDEKGIMRGLSVGMGPDIAWFKDPSGNVVSVLQEAK